MDEHALKELFTTVEDSIRQAIYVINRGAKGLALVVDSDHNLLGTISDGDIRRSILQGVGLEAPVSVLLEQKVDSLYPTPVTAQQLDDEHTILTLMHQHSIYQIPLLDEADRVVDLVTMDDLLPPHLDATPVPLQAVVMAGGFGTRLRPLTEDLPKPMLPVGERPLLELILGQLRKSGINRVNVTTHYKPEKITEHFGDGHAFGIALNYISEKEPLGTAGALGLMTRPEDPVLVMNGDILTQINFQAMFAFHRRYKADLTVAVRQYAFQVPYGVMESEGPYVKHIAEKPRYHFLVNAGIYLLEPAVYEYIPSGKRFDMTDLITILLQTGLTVVNFPIVEYWLDIGQYDDYEQAKQDIQNGRFSV